jgi:Icc-related predicted phosphoesterase
MKIQIVSDLHTEFLRPQEVEKYLKRLKSDAEVIVLAGDICSRNKIIYTLSIFSEMYEHVVYVNGNHELYGTHIDKIRETRQYVPKNVHWLDNSCVEIKNQRFIGCTMWFRNDSMNSVYERGMNDFYSILNFRDYVYRENENSVNYLSSNVQENDIVITHHLPSYKLVNWKYLNSPLNRFFVCEMDELIKKNNPKYWIFGHTHEKTELDLFGCKMIANPHGYPDEFTAFDFQKIISI